MHMRGQGTEIKFQSTYDNHALFFEPHFICSSSTGRTLPQCNVTVSLEPISCRTAHNEGDTMGGMPVNRRTRTCTHTKTHLMLLIHLITCLWAVREQIGRKGRHYMLTQSWDLGFVCMRHQSSALRLPVALTETKQF